MWTSRLSLTNTQFTNVLLHIVQFFFSLPSKCYHTKQKYNPYEWKRIETINKRALREEILPFWTVRLTLVNCVAKWSPVVQSCFLSKSSTHWRICATWTRSSPMIVACLPFYMSLHLAFVAPFLWCERRMCRCSQIQPSWQLGPHKLAATTLKYRTLKNDCDNLKIMCVTFNKNS